jgi:ribonucleoside-diphosphate reductase beta chain
MSRYADDNRDLRLDPDGRVGGYFKHAVYNHWDPYEDIEQELIEQDRRRMIEADEEIIDEEGFDDLRQTIALFGAGEEAVTEDLAPLAIAMDDINDQMFVSSQIYEEAKHTAFFDRYWREVINPVAEHHDLEVTNPTDDRYFMPAYNNLFDDTEAAMHRLLEEDTPENRVRAFCHYHLAVESVLAQTGYYGITSSFSDGGGDITLDDVPEFPELEGLVKGVGFIRSDEGRHVGFGMYHVQEMLASGQVEEQVVQDVLQEQMPNIAGIVSYSDSGFIDPSALVEYASDKLTRRIEIITDSEADIPPVDELVKLDDGEGGSTPSPAAGDD